MRNSHRPWSTTRTPRRVATALLAGAAMALVLLTACSATAKPPKQSDAVEQVGNRGVSARLKGFPRPVNTGVPRGWQPRKTVNGDLTVTKDGAVVEDVRVYGDLVINAEKVTVRRVDVVGGQVKNTTGGSCGKGLKLIEVTIRNDPDHPTTGEESPAIGEGGYTARRVEIKGMPEGFRVGSVDACGRVVIKDSFATVTPPRNCDDIDWHGDTLQGYGGGALKIRNTRLVLENLPSCGGTAPFFYPDGENNTSVDVDGLIVEGGGYPFRLGMPGKVRNLKIVQGSFEFGPIDVICGLVSVWDAAIVTLDAKGQPHTVRKQRCT